MVGSALHTPGTQEQGRKGLTGPVLLSPLSLDPTGYEDREDLSLLPPPLPTGPEVESRRVNGDSDDPPAPGPAPGTMTPSGTASTRHVCCTVGTRRPGTGIDGPGPPL